MTELSINTTLFSKDFCLRWSDLLKELYNYEFENGFAIVKRFLGSKIYSYLPILSYTDITLNSAKNLIEELKNKNYQIRALNFYEKNITAGSPVTLRINFENLSFDEVKNSFSSRLKRYLNNSDFSDFKIEIGDSDNIIETFYSIFQKIMHRHGTPSLPKKLFILLPHYFKTNYYILTSKKLNKIISAACILKDNNFCWIPWSGTINQAQNHLAGHFLYYNIIKSSFESKDKFFDFGRSAYLSSNYEFKRRWGAIPIKIEVLTNKNSDIYNKYKFASSIWKKLPFPFANFIGPKLCKYLKDL